MSQLLQKYCKYLLTLSKSQLSKQFKYLNIDKPLHQKRMQVLIHILLSKGDHNLIQNRLNYLRIQQLSRVKKEEDNASKSELQQKDSIFEYKSQKIKQNQINFESALGNVRRHLYNHLAYNYNQLQQQAALKATASSSPQVSKARNLPTQEDIALLDPSPLNILYHVSPQLRLNSSKQTYEYHRNISELILSIFPERSEAQMSTKLKQQAKKIQTKGSLPMTGNTKVDLMTIYGILKEQEFMEELSDPLENLLNKKNKQNSADVVKFLSKLHNRYQYYEAVIVSLELQKLHSLIRYTYQHKDKANMSEFFLRNSCLAFTFLVRKNPKVFNQNYYSSLLNKKQAHKQKGILERWTLTTLYQFKEMVQDHDFTIQNQSQLLANVLRYREIKANLRKQLQKYKQQRYLTQLADFLDPIDHENFNVAELFSQVQSEAFDERILQLLLFVDVHATAPSQILDKLTFYKYMIAYLVQRKHKPISFHMSDKAVQDLNYLLEKALTLKNQATRLNLLLNDSFIVYCLQLLLLDRQFLQTKFIHSLLSHLWSITLKNSIILGQQKLTLQQGQLLVLLVRLTVSVVQVVQGSKISHYVENRQFLALLNQYMEMLACQEDQGKEKGYITVRQTLMPFLQALQQEHSKSDLESY